mgnify:CR=1 FL=1
MRNYDSQLRRDGFTSPELQKLTPALRAALEEQVLAVSIPARLAQAGGAHRPSNAENCRDMISQLYRNQRVAANNLPVILGDIQRCARESQLTAGETAQLLAELQPEFTDRAVDTELAALPNSVGPLIDRWKHLRQQFQRLQFVQTVLDCAIRRLDESALERLLSADIGGIVITNIRDRWGDAVRWVQPLPEPQRRAVKRRLFRRYLNAAVPSADSDLWWMTSIIYGEAAGEQRQGKLAVGWVIMNRLAAQNPMGWTGHTEFGTTIRQIIQGGNFDAFTIHRLIWDRPMSYHTRDDFEHSQIENESDAERGAILESLAVADVSMRRSEADPTIGGFDGMGATFFGDFLNEARQGRVKQTADDLALNDLKALIGAHMFWDRSQEWWWCDWQARRLPQGVALPQACYDRIGIRPRPDNIGRYLPEEDIQRGVQELDLRNRARR